MCAKVQKIIIFTRMHVKFFPFERLFAYNHGGRMGFVGFRFGYLMARKRERGEHLIYIAMKETLTIVLRCFWLFPKRLFMICKRL